MKDECKFSKWEPKCFLQRDSISKDLEHGFSGDMGEATVAGVGERGEDSLRSGQRGRQESAHAALGSHVENFTFNVRGMGSHLNSGGSHQVSLWNRSLQPYVYFMQNMEFGVYSGQR